MEMLFMLRPVVKRITLLPLTGIMAVLSGQVRVKMRYQLIARRFLLIITAARYLLR
jgi:hypothetical protein